MELDRRREANYHTAASVTKNKREHTFPYGRWSLTCSIASNRQSKFLFPGSKDVSLPITGWSNFKAAFDKDCTVSSWTLHDLRRTFATNLAALGVRLEVTEKLLKPRLGEFRRHRRVYQRMAT